MKFQRLTQKELESLKDDFVEFLASNSIEAKEWEALKKNENDKAEKLIEMFSDIVWERVLSNNRFLDQLNEKEFKCYKFNDSHVHVIIAKVKEGEDKVKLNNKNFVKTLKNGLMKGRIELFEARRPYEKDREQEMLVMLQGGAILSRGNWYTTLKEIVT